MSRKHFIAIAKAFASTRPVGTVPTTEAMLAQWEDDRDVMIEVLRGENPRFDRERFIAATEVK